MSETSYTEAILADLPARYRFILCDLWGCVHNGVAAYPEALTLLRKWRAQGRFVTFLTNAPRPSSRVEQQLGRLGVGQDCYDLVVSSGDAGIHAMRKDFAGKKAGFIGAREDMAALQEAGLDIEARLDADLVICTGFHDDRKNNIAAYKDNFAAMIARDARLICFNPDKLVLRGDSIELCAGALAAHYESMGGKVILFGKPDPKIYEFAQRRISARFGHTPTFDQLLALGDGPATDLLGAARADIDFVFVSGGIEASEYRAKGRDKFFADVSAIYDLGCFRPITVVERLG